MLDTHKSTFLQHSFYFSLRLVALLLLQEPTATNGPTAANYATQQSITATASPEYGGITSKCPPLSAEAGSAHHASIFSTENTFLSQNALKSQAAHTSNVTHSPYYLPQSADGRLRGYGAGPLSPTSQPIDLSNKASLTVTSQHARDSSINNQQTIGPVSSKTNSAAGNNCLPAGNGSQPYFSNNSTAAAAAATTEDDDYDT